MTHHHDVMKAHRELSDACKERGLGAPIIERWGGRPAGYTISGGILVVETGDGNGFSVGRGYNYSPGHMLRLLWMLRAAIENAGDASLRPRYRRG